MKLNRRGFTMAELLIVVAIVAILVAIAIPYLTSGLEKSRETADIANVRSAFASIVNGYIESGVISTIEVPVTQRVPDWQVEPMPLIYYQVNGVQHEIEIPNKTEGTYSVTMEPDSTGNALPKIS